MPTIEDLQFDTSGWKARAESLEGRRAWKNEWGDVLTLRYNAGTPKFPSLFRTQALRDYYTHQVTAGGGCILSVELLHVKGIAISKLIFKTPQPDGGWGYMGSLNLAYQDFSYSLRLQALDGAGDEMRSQYVWNSLRDTKASEADCLALWFGEDTPPADLAAAHPCMADDLRWDAEFPQHPLSRLRAALHRIIPSLEVSRDVKNSTPHRG